MVNYFDASEPIPNDAHANRDKCVRLTRAAARCGGYMNRSVSNRALRQVKIDLVRATS
jgi:hypothetical protein